jgi:hypothetical protein
MLTNREVRHALYVENRQNNPTYIDVSGELFVVERVEIVDGDVHLIAHQLESLSNA